LKALIYFSAFVLFSGETVYNENNIAVTALLKS
jgi:hypothetical protein